MAEKKSTTDESAMYNISKEIDGDTLAYILRHFSYNPNTGEISRNDRKNSNGSIDKDGYLILKIKSRQYKAHRLAWLLYYGHSPKMEIDHINRNRRDNRISNLREADRILNISNTTKKPNPKTGVVGVYIDNITNGLKKKFTTKVNKKLYRFYTLKDAIEFRKSHNLQVNL